MYTFHRKQDTRAGFSIIEMLVYIAILALVCGAALTLLFTLDDRIATQKANQLVARNAQTFAERVLTEIRIADAVDPFTTTLETNPGALGMVYGATTTEFFLATSTIYVRVNGGVEAALTDQSVTVNELRFFSYSNAETDMVRAEVTLSATVGDVTVEKSFQTGAVLRGTYE